MKLLVVISIIFLLVLTLSSFEAQNASTQFMASAMGSNSQTKGCFNTVPSGSVIESQNSSETIVLLPNGKTEVFSAAAGTCTATEAYPLTLNNCCVEYSYTTNSLGFRQLSGEWYVPQNPSNQGSQLLSFWQGIQTSDGSEIVQPVTTWGCQSSFFFCLQGGSFWWIAAEFCTQGALISCSWTSAIQVGIDDSVQGSISFSAGCSKNTPEYTTTIKDITNGKSATLYSCVGSAYPEALPGAFEADSVNYCNQLPNQSGEAFFSITSNPSITYWGTYTTPNSPQCSFSVSAGSGYTNLYWTP